MKFAHFEFDLKDDLIGSGQSSHVYKAKDLSLDRTVVLKVLEAHVTIDPEAKQRFSREARTAGSLAHPNLAAVHEFGTVEVQGQERSYIAMEFVEGKPLDKVIKGLSTQLLGYEECLKIGEQVADALATVHESGILHRDLKPGNIMRMDDGTVKLLDFGIARTNDSTKITQAGMLVGTVLYMSPEQVRGEKLELSSDVFAFGSVLYHLCTGKLPFPGSSFPEVCMSILDCEPISPKVARPGFPEPINALLTRCLEPEPVDRFTNGREVHTAILGVIKEMHSATSALQAAEGELYILPFNSPKRAADLTAGARRDLAADLQRTKRLSVHLVDDVDAKSESSVDFLLSAELSPLPAGAKLELHLERWGDGERGRAVVQEWDDSLTVQEEDEWALQEALARGAARLMRHAMREVVIRPTAELGKNVGRADELAQKAHDRLLRGTSKHIFSCVSMVRGAIESKTYSPRAYSCLSEAMVRKFLMWDGDPSYLDEARDFADHALSIDAECAEAHTSLGFAYQHSGQPTDAQREYRIAIQIDPDEWMAHSYLGALLAREGNFLHAQEHLEKAIKIRPRHIGSSDNLYLVHMRLGATDEAIEVAERGIENGLAQLIEFPDDQEARTHTALLFARLGRGEEARELVDEARERYPKDGFTNFRIACIYAALGEGSDHEEAVRELTAARDRGYHVSGELLGATDLEILRSLPGFEDILL